MRSPRTPGAVAAALAVVGFVVLTMVLGGPSRGAAALPDQILTTLRSTPRTTTPAPTVATSATTAHTATTIRSTSPTTAPRSVVPASTSRQSYSPTTLAPTTTIPTTTTTILGIGGRVPAAPVTLPLQTKGSNGHVSPVFAWLSGIGLAIALLIIATRLFVTRPGGKDRAPLV